MHTYLLLERYRFWLLLLYNFILAINKKEARELSNSRVSVWSRRLHQGSRRLDPWSRWLKLSQSTAQEFLSDPGDWYANPVAWISEVCTNTVAWTSKKKKKKTLLSSYRSIWPLKIRIGKQSPSSVKHERKEIHLFCLIVFVMAMKILIQISFGH